MAKLLFILQFTVQMIYSQVPVGDRIISLDVSEAENQDYEAAFNMARDACMLSTNQFYPWSALEPTPEEFDQSFLSNVESANIFFPAFGVKVELSIPVINTVTREVPPDLETVSFDSPVFIDRFKTMLDTLFSRMPDIELAVLNIGNEHGFFLGDSARVEQYIVFFEAAKSHAEALYFNLHGADLKVGTTLTFGALVDPALSGLMEHLNESADIISVTYYPLNENFTVRQPEEVLADFSQLVSLYRGTGKSIYFAECGYPSSPVCNSSEEMQKAFIENVFAAWDTHSDVIKYISFFKLTDWSQETVDELAPYYGLSDNNQFKEYLRTLGLRTYPGDGRSKPAYEALKCEASKRGFCETTCDSMATFVHSSADAIPEILLLKQNYPNPFNPETSIIYQLSVASAVHLTVYNLLGQEVRQLVSEKQSTGVYRVQWDGKDAVGRAAPSGLYLYRLKAGEEIQSKKMLFMK